MTQTFEIELPGEMRVGYQLIRALLTDHYDGLGKQVYVEVTEITEEPISVCLSDRKAISDETLGNCAETHDRPI